jgi:ubiquinone/menaquinone biosynthesis C-methylase UbiE/chorismate mutase
MKNYNKIIENFWNKEVKNFYEDTPSEYLYKFFSVIKNKSSKKVLDVGCGAGRNALMIQKLGYKIYGCDSNKKMVVVTKERLPLKVRKNITVSDMTSLPYEDNIFDYVVSNGVFHNALNLKDFCSSVKESSRVLKNNGCLVLNVFTFGDLKGEFIKGRMKKYFYLTKDSLPIILLPTIDLIKILSKNNFALSSFEENYVTVSTGKRKILKGIFIKLDNTKSKDISLHNFRILIDYLDEDILKLLSKRVNLVKIISEYKKKRGLPFSDYKREIEIKNELSYFSNLEKLGFDEKEVKNIVNFLLKTSKK